MAHSINRRYRFGSSFVDEESGIRLEGHHPAQRPDLWKMYLEGALGTYRDYGLEDSLYRRDLESGKGVSLFFLAFDAHDRPVGGMRIHGPLEHRYQSAIIGEMAASPEIGEIGDLIDRECRLGALEIKGAWSKGEAVTGHRLLGVFCRTVIHSLNWLGAEFAILAVADRLLPIGEVTGAIRVGSVPVAYPDERYRTVAVSYRRTLSYELSSDENQRALRREAEQLARGPGTLAGSEAVSSTQYQSRHALVLDASSRSDREVVRILREDDSLQLLDQYDEQRLQLTSLVGSSPDDYADEGQRWVYYPWRRSIVRLLGPRSFDYVRLNRNRNKLTAKEQAALRALRIGVIGASAGHAIAYALAIEGIVGELRLADFDTVELTNLNRIPAGVMDIGINKAVVAARRIAEIDPYLPVEVFSDGVSNENLGRFLDGLDLVVEECDSLDIKMLVRELARERRIPVIMETSDRGVLDVERFDLEPNRPVFHGLLGGITSTILAGLTTEQKGPFVVQILGANDVSARAAASALELGHSISGWPQLASEVTLGGVTVAAAVRRFGLGGELPSGRVRFDVEQLLEGLAEVPAPPSRAHGLRTPAPVEQRTSSTDPIDQIVDAARLAPSGGNVQPWRFVTDGVSIQFHLDPTKTSVMDVQHRGSYLALGAALFNARVMAASLHRLGSVQLFPDSSNPWHVATMTLGTALDPEIAELAESLVSRSANRRMGLPGTIEPMIVERMRRAVEREGASLHVTTERERLVALAGQLGEADRLRFLIDRVYSDMMGELRWPGSDDLHEGLDVRTLEMDPGTLGLFEILQRRDVLDHLDTWQGGRILSQRTQGAVITSSGLCLVTVPRSEPTWYVRAGAAVERLWLLGEQHGIAMQPVSPLYLFATSDDDLIALGGERRASELAAHREGFRQAWRLPETEAMAMVLRLFYAEAPTVHSIRQPLSNVLTRTATPLTLITNEATEHSLRTGRLTPP